MLVAFVLAHHLVANVAFAPVVTVAVTAAAAAAISFIFHQNRSSVKERSRCFSQGSDFHSVLGKDLGREDARDLVRPRSRAPLELTVTTFLGPVDLETLGYSDH